MSCPILSEAYARLALRSEDCASRLNEIGFHRVIIFHVFSQSHAATPSGGTAPT
jgi:hypothetical protein